MVAVQECNVDACNQHVGAGGGQPHLHGDPFSSTDGVCLYGPANYTSTTMHPPQIGWSLDGYSIYGRHFNAANQGYANALDDCGGHTHDGMTCALIIRMINKEGYEYPEPRVYE